MTGDAAQAAAASGIRAYDPWTPVELDLAARADLSDHEIAVRIGRSESAVRHQRWRLRRSQRDPSQIPHGLNGYNNYGCRCPLCSDANAQRTLQVADTAHATTRRRNAESRDRASQHGQPWTTKDLDLVVSSDLPAPDLAAMLGRTVAAVREARRQATRALDGPGAPDRRAQR
jgi:hypothetical protein